MFPNPFIVKGFEMLHFRLPPVTGGTAQLTILTSHLDRVVTRTVTVSTPHPSEPVLLWDGRSDTGEAISSGVYFYFIIVDDRQMFGKFAVVRN